MASDYAYITLANLEDFTGIDYSTIDATKLADAKIEKKISIAEKIVTAYLGYDAAQTVTDGIEVATLCIAAKLVHNTLVIYGFQPPEYNIDLIMLPIRTILSLFLDNDADVSVDGIPMSGANDTIIGNRIY